jgi:hypothetical protein
MTKYGHCACLVHLAQYDLGTPISLGDFKQLAKFAEDRFRPSVMETKGERWLCRQAAKVGRVANA